MEVWWKVVRKMQKPLVDRKSGTRAWHAKPYKVAVASTMAVATAIPQTLLPAYMMGWTPSGPEVLSSGGREWHSTSSTAPCVNITLP